MTQGMADKQWQMEKNNQATLSSEEHISGDPVTFIENFTPRTFLEKQQKQMDPMDRGENILLLSYKNSVCIMPVKPTGNFLWSLAKGSPSP